MKLRVRIMKRSTMSIELNLLLMFSCLTAFVASRNVTTVFQLEANTAGSSSTGYENYGTWRVVSRNGARGIPVRKGNIGLSNTWVGQPCCETWSHDGWSKLSSEKALKENPPLVLDSLESADSTLLAKSSVDARHLKQDSSGVWRGTMVPNSRVRLNFIPPRSGRAALGIFLCGSEGAEDVQCVAVVITGASSNGKTLRYQTTRYGSRETGSRGPTPNGNLKTYIVHRDDRVREGWQGNNIYNFRIERSSQGDLEVQLDNGDPSQRRKMAIPAGFTYSQLAVSLLAVNSDTARQLTVTEETAWQGELPAGGSIKINFLPLSNNTGHLGFAFCNDRFREQCTAQVIDGISGGALVRSEPAYWTAGNKEADKPIPDSAKNAKWGKPTYTFTLSRAHDGTVTITVDGDNRKYTWPVPANYQLLIVDSYHDQGKAIVNTAGGSISASVWKLDREVAELRSAPIPEWYVASDVCVSIVARVAGGSRLAISVQRFTSSKESRELETITGTSNPEWITKRIVIPPSRILQNNKVQIVLTGRQSKDTKGPVLVQWAAGCDPSSREDEVTIKGFVPLSTVANQVGFKSAFTDEPTEVYGLSLKAKRHSICENDGLLNKFSHCVCRPGFTGRLCEQGCGPNRFGENCESSCSDKFSPRECEGMWLCTSDLPCDCGPGFKGPMCNEPCEHGKYGVGCRQSCGKCQYGQTCDRYTGWCSTGCQGSYLPPFCRDECGRKAPVVPFIGNGPAVDQLQYPWHVGIYNKSYVPDGFNDNDSITDHKCSGTLITRDIVVSAAHCFYDKGAVGGLLPADQFSVAVGKTKREWNAQEEFPERTQKRNIEAIYIPPEFQGVTDSKDDDIAVLVLSVPVDESDYVIPACFDKVGGFEEELTRGSVGYVAGWGRTEGNIPSEVLREANLPFIPRLECLNLLPTTFRPYVSAKDRFCAGEQGGTYVNRGDSGGGLVFLQNNAWFLRGVVSVAPPVDKSISAFTNVSYHRDWIVQLEQVAALRKAYSEAFLSG